MSDLAWQEGMSEWKPIHTFANIVEAVLPPLPLKQTEQTASAPALIHAPKAVEAPPIASASSDIVKPVIIPEANGPSTPILIQSTQTQNVQSIDEITIKTEEVSNLQHCPPQTNSPKNSEIMSSLKLSGELPKPLKYLFVIWGMLFGLGSLVLCGTASYFGWVNYIIGMFLVTLVLAMLVMGTFTAFEPSFGKTAPWFETNKSSKPAKFRLLNILFTCGVFLLGVAMWIGGISVAMGDYEHKYKLAMVIIFIGTGALTLGGKLFVSLDDK